MDTAETVNLSEIKSLSKKLARQIKGGEIFGLMGPLGAGKTTLVKAVGKELKIRHNIPSPTFILLQAFEARLAHREPRRASTKTKKKLLFYHLDLYRTKNFREVKNLGVLEFWGKPNTVTFIEWADKIKKYLPEKTRIIKFKN